MWWVHGTCWLIQPQKVPWFLTVSSKHVLNAQVSIRSPCCEELDPVCSEGPSLTPLRIGKKWFDCVDCHQEQEDHALLQRFEMIFACKKCKKCFRKDAREFEEADEYCPHCDNHFILDAITPKAAISVEGEDARVDNRMLKDDRVKGQDQRTIFDPEDNADKLG